MWDDVEAPDPSDRRSLFFKAMTGREAAAVSGSKSESILDMLKTVAHRPNGTVDTKRAAQELGVSQRTIQRWVKGTQKPNLQHGKTLQKKSRQVASTKAGRKKAIQESLKGSRKRMAQRGAKITVKGMQGVSGANSMGDDYKRLRSATLNLTPDQMQDLMHAYAETGDRGIGEYLEKLYSDNYGAGQWNMKWINEINLKEI